MSFFNFLQQSNFERINLKDLFGVHTVTSFNSNSRKACFVLGMAETADIKKFEYTTLIHSRNYVNSWRQSELNNFMFQYLYLFYRAGK